MKAPSKEIYSRSTQWTQYWKVYSMGFNTVADCEITRISDKIWPHSSSSSSKVIDLGVNQKCICDFLL